MMPPDKEMLYRVIYCVVVAGIAAMASQILFKVGVHLRAELLCC